MSQRNHQAGFSIIELGIVIIVLGIVALLAVVGYNRWQENTAPKTDTTSQTKDASVPEVNSTSDLDSAADSLDQTDLSTEDNKDASELDSQAAAF